MSRPNVIDPSTAPGPVASWLADIESKMGGVADTRRIMARSSAFLEGNLPLRSALADGAADPQLHGGLSI